MKKYTMILMLLVNCLFAAAQDEVAAAMKQINSIKSDDAYINAESTSAKWEDAYDNAKALLEIKIEEWAREKSKTEDVTGCIAKAENSILEIKARRGKLFRAFLYVKKADIMTYAIEKELVVIPVEQPTKKNETKISVKHTEAETVQVIIPDQPQPEPAPAYQPSEDERKMLKVASFHEIESFIKGNNAVLDYGKYATIPTIGDFYVFVYNREYEISAYLKHSSEGYININTGKQDDVKNYKGSGAIWFRVK